MAGTKYKTLESTNCWVMVKYIIRRVREIIKFIQLFIIIEMGIISLLNFAF